MNVPERVELVRQHARGQHLVERLGCPVCRFVFSGGIPSSDARCTLCTDPPMTGPRQAIDHVGVRFNDHDPDLRVFLDGQDVTLGTFEARAGEPGWVLRYPGPPKVRCPNDGTHAYAIRMIGTVIIGKVERVH